MTDSRRICSNQGRIDHMIRRAIACGIDPVTVFQMATLNAADWFGLHDRGAIAPGRLADFVIFDDLKSPTARAVYTGGKLLQARSSAIEPKSAAALIEKCQRQLGRGSTCLLPIPARAKFASSRALRDQLVTRSLVMEPKEESGDIIADSERDILKMAVIERHRPAAGIVPRVYQGFRSKDRRDRRHGRPRSSQPHRNRRRRSSMIGRCTKRLADAAAVTQSRRTRQTLGTLALPIAGLMSDEPIECGARDYDAFSRRHNSSARTIHDPFMAMSFMALEVIPR